MPPKWNCWVICLLKSKFTEDSPYYFPRGWTRQHPTNSGWGSPFHHILASTDCFYYFFGMCCRHWTDEDSVRWHHWCEMISHSKPSVSGERKSSSYNNQAVQMVERHRHQGLLGIWLVSSNFSYHPRLSYMNHVPGFLVIILVLPSENNKLK